MNDPIKDFVKQHREEFDHLEAPVFNLEQMKARMKQVPEEPKRNVLLLNVNKWLVAASVVLAITCGWLFFNNKNQPVASLPLAQQTKDTVRPAATAGQQETLTEIPVDADTQPRKVVLASNHAVTTIKTANKTPTIYQRLQDSTSASSRLLAILELEKAGKADDKVMDMLAKTLNNDQNTNVRLAALSLMEKFSTQKHVSNLLINSLDRQDDPMVQLGLVSLLGKMKNIKIDDKLQALASNPDTFAAVRDEAYNILLNQNKL